MSAATPQGRITRSVKRLDELTHQYSGIGGWDNLINALGNYAPTMIWNRDREDRELYTFGNGRAVTTALYNAELAELANAYDYAQARRGDPRRVYRSGDWPQSAIIPVTSHGLLVGDGVELEINQSLRDGWVIAVIGEEVLFTYEMPAGRIFLGIHTYKPENPNLRGGAIYRSVSVRSLSKRWQQAIVDQQGNLSVDDVIQSTHHTANWAPQWLRDYDLATS